MEDTFFTTISNTVDNVSLHNVINIIYQKKIWFARHEYNY